MYIVVFQTKGQYSPLDQDIMSVFGAGTAVDTSKTTAVFDFAAQVTNQSTASSHVTQYSSLIGPGAGGLQDAGPLLRQA